MELELSIRKLGNSAGILLPAALLRSLHLSIGSSVTAEKVEGKLVLTPAVKPRYRLGELVAQCDPKAPPPKDMQVWDSVSAVSSQAGASE